MGELAERRVIAVAARQHGAITLAQLVVAGLSRHQVARLVRSGWLRRLHHGVYLVGPLETPFTRPMAAVLASGEKGVLSHDSAAVQWGICPPPIGEIHVTVVTRSGVHSRAGIHVHRCGDLDPLHATRRNSVPITSPARTLLDMATRLMPRDLARAVEEAQVRHLVTDRSLNEQFKRYPNHRGTPALREAIQPEPALTRSEAERRLLELIRAARLPAPQTNVRIGRH